MNTFQTSNHPYFIQTQSWASFWKESNGANHLVHPIDIGEVKPTFVYQYPWYFGQNFLYIPSGPVISDIDTLSTKLDIFTDKLKDLGGRQSSTFIKLDLAFNLTSSIKQSINPSGLAFVESFLGKSFSAIKLARKRIMYLSTIVLELGKLTLPDPEHDPMNSIRTFFDINSVFWKQVNSGHRSKTKKSLEENWSFTTEKSQQNFDYFWNVYCATAKRQNFTTQPRDYFKNLYAKEDSVIIILLGENGNPESVWFGLVSGESLIYLYGGNTQRSMSRFGQYLVHLIALFVAKGRGMKFYDLGGYDPHEGYGVFKERYKGEIINFDGPFDLVLQPAKYNYTETAIKIGKQLKSFL